MFKDAQTITGRGNFESDCLWATCPIANHTQWRISYWSTMVGQKNHADHFGGDCRARTFYLGHDV
ncbi:hypothetical protein M0N77_05170 [Psychrobacter sp. AH5]|uniref:hypothetical protein n=1 Tax=Psychrobacter sp. AH5 TaxID=2937433 RepID=UPI00333E44FF